MRKYCREFGKEINSISSYALGLLLEYEFPGNVRELENIIEKSVALGTSSIILPETLNLPKYNNSSENIMDLDFPEELKIKRKVIPAGDSS